MTEPIWIPDAATPVVFARLSGDHNPVHLDAAHARAAGFRDVIVHGMCTLGASARAAQVFAPAGSTLRALDVRFANPVLPGEVVTFTGSVKDKDGASKVSLVPGLPGERKVMSPATFTFGDGPTAADDVARDEAATAEGDVAGDRFSFAADALLDYDRITRSDATSAGEGIPMMVGLLGMTGALEGAFRRLQPPARAGTWVHLRQSATFYEPIVAGREYRCRIQTARNVVRESKPGVMITIPFVVERADDGALVSTGSCGLLYAFTEVP